MQTNTHKNVQSSKWLVIKVDIQYTNQMIHANEKLVFTLQFIIITEVIVIDDDKTSLWLDSVSKSRWRLCWLTRNLSSHWMQFSDFTENFVRHIHSHPFKLNHRFGLRSAKFMKIREFKSIQIGWQQYYTGIWSYHRS